MQRSRLQRLDERVDELAIIEIVANATDAHNDGALPGQHEHSLTASAADVEHAVVGERRQHGRCAPFLH